MAFAVPADGIVDIREVVVSTIPLLFGACLVLRACWTVVSAAVKPLINTLSSRLKDINNRIFNRFLTLRHGRVDNRNKRKKP